MLLIGPAGAGSPPSPCNLSSRAARRGEKAAPFIFDEELGLLLDRTRLLGIDLEAMWAAGNLFIEQIDAAEFSPGEFSHRVRTSIDAPWRPTA